MPRQIYPPSGRPHVRDLAQEHAEKERQAWGAICDDLRRQLTSGELIATAFEAPFTLDSQRRQIPADLWTKLRPKYGRSSAAWGELELREILVQRPRKPSDEPRAESDGHPADATERQPERRGPGRPSLMEEIKEQMKRRAKMGQLEPSQRRESEALAAWARDQFAGEHTPKPNSIKKATRSLYNELKKDKKGR